MASLLFCILIGISSNFDNVGIGLSYGVRHARIPWLFCSLTALTSFTACILGSVTGWRITHLMSATTCSLLGSSIMVCIGLWTVIQTMISKTDDPDTAITIGFSELMFMALAQGLTDLSIGFGAGFAKLNVLSIALSVGAFSFLFLLIPARLGMRLVSNKLGKSATLLSGLLLIVVGLYL